MSVEKELDRILTLLRNKIREKGFTQLEVQDALGWGRSYISQLLTKQKSLRVEQVLRILGVIGVDPAQFFGELYHFMPHAGVHLDEYPDPRGLQRGAQALEQEVDSMRTLLDGVVTLLTEKDVFEPEQVAALRAAAAAAIAEQA
ncbi:MAG: helix-turn-helix transcriptional regulator [Acidobacteriota bacterium]